MQKIKCAHEPCQCALLDDQGVNVDGVHYCSDGCAEGRGCECPNCNCVGEIRHEVTTPQEETL